MTQKKAKIIMAAKIKPQPQTGQKKKKVNKNGINCLFSLAPK